MAQTTRRALEIGAEGTLYSHASSAQGNVTGLGHNYYYSSDGTGKFMRANEEAATMEIYNGGFYFYSDSRTDQSADANVSVTSKLTILADGNVGIGDTSPSHTLVVKGVSGTSPIINVINSDTEDNDTGRESTIRFSGFRSGGEAVDNGQITGTHDGSSDDDKGMLTFFTNGGSGQTEKMRITSAGNVGIGTNAPDCNLDVAVASGQQRVRIASLSSGNALLDIQAGGANDPKIRFYEDTTFKWQINNNAGGSDRLEIINGSGVGVKLTQGAQAWDAQSDERLKENLVEITNATQNLNQLRCVNFNFKFDKEKIHLGLIAQEVQKFYPQIVSGDPSKEIEETFDEDGMIQRSNVMGLQYQSLIPVLVKSIQELTKRIEELEK
jgi:hypothetical protein